MVNDSHFIPRSLERVTTNRDHLLELARAGKDVPLGHELKKSVWDYHRFYRMGYERAEFDQLADQASTYQQLVSALFDGFARRSGKTLAGEKTPNYVRRARLLLSMFPQAAFVNIVRDGRDVALSLMDWATPDKGPGRFAYWRVDPVAISALWWSDFVLRGAKYASQFPHNFQTVRYEELLEQPAECLRSICQSAGIDYEPSMLDFHVGKQQADPEASAKKNWLPPTKGLRDWRSAMSTEDSAVFNRLAGEVLMALGYEMKNDSSSRAAVKRSAKATAWWQAHKNEFR